MLVLCLFISIGEYPPVKNNIADSETSQECHCKISPYIAAIHNVAYSFAADDVCPTERCPLLFVPEFQCADNTTHNMTFGDDCSRIYFNCYNNTGLKNILDFVRQITKISINLSYVSYEYKF